MVVTKDGYAGVDSQPFGIQAGDVGVPQVIAPIRLSPGVSLSGNVVDPHDQPVTGAWVTLQDSYSQGSQFTRTDEKGHFTVRNLPKGMIRISFSYGPLAATGKFLADGIADKIDVKLRPLVDIQADGEARRAVKPQPLAVGQLAPELQVRGWTDDKSQGAGRLQGVRLSYSTFGVSGVPHA